MRSHMQRDNPIEIRRLGKVESNRQQHNNLLMMIMLLFSKRIYSTLILHVCNLCEHGGHMLAK